MLTCDEGVPGHLRGGHVRLLEAPPTSVPSGPDFGVGRTCLEEGHHEGLLLLLAAGAHQPDVLGLQVVAWNQMAIAAQVNAGIWLDLRCCYSESSDGSPGRSFDLTDRYRPKLELGKATQLVSGPVMLKTCQPWLECVVFTEATSSSSLSLSTEVGTGVNTQSGQPGP